MVKKPIFLGIGFSDTETGPAQKDCPPFHDMSLRILDRSTIGSDFRLRDA